MGRLARLLGTCVYACHRLGGVATALRSDDTCRRTEAAQRGSRSVGRGEISTEKEFCSLVQQTAFCGEEHTRRSEAPKPASSSPSGRRRHEQHLGSNHLRRPDPLLDGRRRLIGQVGRAVVWQALEIGPDQGFIGRRQCAALAAIDLSSQENELLSITAIFRPANGRPRHEHVPERQLGVVARY